MAFHDLPWHGHGPSWHRQRLLWQWYGSASSMPWESWYFMEAHDMPWDFLALTIFHGLVHRRQGFA